MLDLSLAKTYKPVCVCTLLVSVCCLLMCILRAAGVPALNTYVIVACCLFVDSRWRREEIFNANTLAAFVIFSLVLNEERAVRNSFDEHKTVFITLTNIMWASASTTILLRCEAQLAVFRYVPVNSLVATCAMLCVHSGIFQHKETEFIVFLRVFDFVVLSFTWIYLINARNMTSNSVFDCTPCIMQFGCVLFVSYVNAVLYTVLVCMLFAYLYNKSHPGDHSLLTALKAEESEHNSDTAAGQYPGQHPGQTQWQTGGSSSGTSTPREGSFTITDLESQRDSVLTQKELKKLPSQPTFIQKTPGRQQTEEEIELSRVFAEAKRAASLRNTPTH